MIWSCCCRRPSWPASPEHAAFASDLNAPQCQPGNDVARATRSLTRDRTAGYRILIASGHRRVILSAERLGHTLACGENAMISARGAAHFGLGAAFLVLISTITVIGLGTADATRHPFSMPSHAPAVIPANTSSRAA